SFSPYGDGFYDGRFPSIRPFSDGQHRFKFSLGPQDSFAVSLVDGEYIADLHYAGLDGLNIIAHTGNQDDDGYIRSFDDIDFVLPDTDRFNNYLIISGSIENRDGVGCSAGEAAQVPTGRHAANEYAGIGGHSLHPDPVPEDCAAGEWARRVHCDY